MRVLSGTMVERGSATDQACDLQHLAQQQNILLVGADGAGCTQYSPYMTHLRTSAWQERRKKERRMENGHCKSAWRATMTKRPGRPGAMALHASARSRALSTDFSCLVALVVATG
jgi:hypothetical protein